MVQKGMRKPIPRLASTPTSDAQVIEFLADASVHPAQGAIGTLVALYLCGRNGVPATIRIS
jgi:hypothetical protein